MGLQFAERENLLAFLITLESQSHQDVLQNPILLVENIDLVTNGAFIFAILNILAGYL